jgi:hypothetical protein
MTTQTILVYQAIPESYKLFTQLVHDSVDRCYKNRRTKKVIYGEVIKDFKRLIEEILAKDKISNFLIKEEKEYLNFALSVFRKSKERVSFEDYELLVQYSFESVIVRLRKIKEELIDKIKYNKLEVSDIDNEYFFALENILQQVETLDDYFRNKNWTERKDKNEMIKKALLVFKNLNELVLSIAFKDTDSISYISNSILNFDNIQFNIKNKLVS